MNKKAKIFLAVALVAVTAATVWGTSGSGFQGLLRLAPKAVDKGEVALNLGLSQNFQGEKIAVKGANNVKFACFSHQAVGSDLTISSLKFRSLFDIDFDGYSSTGYDDYLGEQDVFLGDLVTAVYLKDGSGFNVRQASTISPKDGTVVFNNLKISSTTQSVNQFCLYGDISSENPIADYEGSKIAFYLDNAGEISAKKSKGIVLNNDQKRAAYPLNQAPSAYIRTIKNGAVNISVDPSTPQESRVAAGTGNVLVSKFKFEAANEAITVSSLSISNSQSSLAPASLGDFDHNVTSVRIEYQDGEGEFTKQTGFLANGNANFENMDFHIGKNKSAILSVFADVADDAVSGERIDLNLTFQNFEAVGETSGVLFGPEQFDQFHRGLTFDPIFYEFNGERTIELFNDFNFFGALGSIHRISVGGGNNVPTRLPIGTILCIGDAGGIIPAGGCSGLGVDIFVIQSIMEISEWEDIYNVVLIEKSTFNNYQGGTPIVYAIPGQGYLIDTNPLVIE